MIEFSQAAGYLLRDPIVFRRRITPGLAQSNRFKTYVHLLTQSFVLICYIDYIKKTKLFKNYLKKRKLKLIELSHFY